MTHRLFSLWVMLLLPLTLLGQARFRVLIDNDLSGDPDGLFQLAPADSSARNLRVYTRLDLRLMIQDFYAKLRQPLLP